MLGFDDSSTLCFHDHRVTCAKEGISKYGHTFGGPIAHPGATRKKCKGRLLHLLHRINLQDPVIGLKIPGVQWLPLYYCFDFRVNAFGYRLTSDADLQVYFWRKEQNVSKEESFPDDDYPTEFPQRKIALKRFSYDPTNRKDAFSMAGVFGIDRLSAKDRAWVLRQEAATSISSETEEELLASLSSPFVQCRPNSQCPNPDCKNHAIRGALQPIALVPNEPVKGVQLFGLYEDDVQLIFELCPDCNTIHVCNQCT